MHRLNQKLRVQIKTVGLLRHRHVARWRGNHLAGRCGRRGRRAEARQGRNGAGTARWHRRCGGGALRRLGGGALRRLGGGPLRGVEGRPMQGVRRVLHGPLRRRRGSAMRRVLGEVGRACGVAGAGRASGRRRGRMARSLRGLIATLVQTAVTPTRSGIQPDSFAIWQPAARTLLDPSGRRKMPPSRPRVNRKAPSPTSTFSIAAPGPGAICRGLIRSFATLCCRSVNREF